MCVLPDGDWVSSGEDGCVKVWREGECVQMMPQPCLSVWTVAAGYVIRVLYAVLIVALIFYNINYFIIYFIH